MSKEFIDVSVVPYALADTLLALYNVGIKEIFITKEDDDIHIRIDKQKVEKSVYEIVDKVSTESNINGDVNNELESLEYGKWYPIEEYFKNIEQMDWALVQFKETKTGFMGLPHIAELKNNKWYLQCDDEESYVKYINEECEPIAFMLWYPYEEMLKNG